MTDERTVLTPDATVPMPRGVRLRIVSGGAARVFEMSQPRVTLGRSGVADIVFTDTSVSGIHAEIVVLHGRAWLRHLSTSNGTYLNDRRCESHEIMRGDVIRLGLVASIAVEDVHQVDVAVASSQSFGSMLGGSVAMRELAAHLRKVGRAGDLNVLITGETGSGKELVARTLHDMSPRYMQGEFVAVSIMQFPVGLLDSALFGHAKGSFTGANEAKAGLFEKADGGTLFLDEIAELTPESQAKLLRVLDGEYYRLGEEHVARRANARVLCATHKNLDELVASGQFREDLFYRLAAVTVSIPPLRERDGDVELLARRFLSDLSPTLSLSSEAVSRLVAYGWPGNVRELKNVIGLAVALCEECEIGADDIRFREAPRGRKAPRDWLSLTLKEATRLLECEMIPQALAQAGNISAAAKLLGLDRSVLRRRIARLGLDRPG